MKLRVLRDVFTDTSTGGRLFVDEKFFCFTLEDVDRKLEENPDAKVHGETCIPRGGEYSVVLDFSYRFQRVMPHILDVPGFGGIRIHAGNEAKNTDGCILVGTTRFPDRIGNSRIAYTKLMEMLDEAYDRREPITLRVS